MFSSKYDHEVITANGNMAVGNMKFKSLKITSKKPCPFFDKPIVVSGPCDTIDVVSGNIIVNGSTSVCSSVSGDIDISGSVLGSASSVSGCIYCTSCRSSSTVSGYNRFEKSKSYK
jgi:hypothetical protein